MVKACIICLPKVRIKQIVSNYRVDTVRCVLRTLRHCFNMILKVRGNTVTWNLRLIFLKTSSCSIRLAEPFLLYS